MRALVNEMVDAGGMTYAFRLAEDTGAVPGHAVRAFRVATEVFGLAGLWAEVATLRVPVPTAPADEILHDSRRLIDTAARWLLTNRPQPLAVPTEIERFAPLVGRLMPGLLSLLRGRDAEAAGTRAAELAEHRVPSDLTADRGGRRPLLRTVQPGRSALTSDRQTRATSR